MECTIDKIPLAIVNLANDHIGTWPPEGIYALCARRGPEHNSTYLQTDLPGQRLPANRAQNFDTEGGVVMPPNLCEVREDFRECQNDAAKRQVPRPKKTYGS